MKASPTLSLLGGLLMAGCLVASCSSRASKTETAHADSLRVLMKTTAESKEAVRMPPANVANRFLFQGKECEAQISRTPDEALPLVQNEQGDKYIDNRVTIHINSQGKTILNQSFTKEDFSSILSTHFLQGAILEGIAYDTIDANHILFAASVSYPESDLYIPIRLSIQSNGKITIEKTDLMDGYSE